MIENFTANIHIVSPEQQVWVVRAEKGNLLPLFRKHGIVAIGHLDILNLPDEQTVFSLKTLKLASRFKQAYQNIAARNLDYIIPSDGTTDSHIRQVHSFVNDMNIGDLVVTLSQKHVLIGRITGLPRLNKNVLYAPDPKAPDRQIELSYNLRRKVSWLQPIPRRGITLPLKKSLKANQTVFRLKDNASLVYHLIYPFFEMNGKLHTSIEINQPENIDNYSVFTLLEFLSIFEVAAKNPNVSLSEIESLTKSLGKNGSLTLETKGHFMSVGDILTNLSGLNTVVPALTFVWLVKKMVWGDTPILPSKSVEFVQDKLHDGLVSLWNSVGGAEVRKRLALTMPSQDTKVIEDNKLDEKSPSE